MRADQKTDALYAHMRRRFGAARARANGYRYEGYFIREQQVLLSLIDPNARTLLDVACGSGLMLRPLLGAERTVLGVDFNVDACAAASANGLAVVRGDAFKLPFASASLDQIVNCQFFNQQTPDGVGAFVVEAARLLTPGGQIVLVWRNGAAYIHRILHICLTGLDRLRGIPEFPQVTHSFADLRRILESAGLEVLREEVSCPPLRWRSQVIDRLPARLLGASCIVVARKPQAQ